ncbi:ureidoglycolate lyase [Phenylobacterium hankyongense]|uniref:Ureidoglycolate lyase n=1 Tax=Phenylobacterium hankyongense TaxID=1813876 RepID=A0A328B426_9CAUL|nr:ureidoglycolate lyase [Phenylobacterium hankyongense]RAK60676.1 ureidoglycolate lyase [Phenylobacterium hankyongense]
MREVIPQPLTADAFAPFGEVIEASDRAEQIAINYGFTTRFNDLADVDVGDEGGRAIVSLFRARPLDPPRLKIFERHPLGSQAFVPLQGRPYLVAVAPPGGFDPAAVQVFRAAAYQGVNYRKGVWHHFLLALEAESDFLVIDRAGPGENLDEIDLAEPDQILVRP